MLPFTTDQFFGVFASYNTAIWPAQVVAYLLGTAALWAIYAARSWSGRTVAAILAALWVWNGFAYHYAFFAPINPAAYVCSLCRGCSSSDTAPWRADFAS
jgi:hypothetical protein